MDKALAVLVLILVVAVLAGGEIYFRMERLRMKSSLLLNSVDLVPWFSHVRSVFSSLPETSQAEYLALIQTHGSIDPDGGRSKVSMANQLKVLAKVELADHLSNGTAVAEAKLATAAWREIETAAGRYNAEIRKLNRALNRPVSGAIGRLFRFPSMEEIRDLSLL